MTAATLQAGPVLPDFSAATFVDPSQFSNPLFPLVPGTRYRYSADVVDPEDLSESEFVQIEDLVTFDTEVVAGVTARVVRAREWHDGVPIEDTFDWYAQDTDGNIWYLGEDTTEFIYDDNGVLTGTSKAGSWRAGENGALPGFIMPLFPDVGFSYYQENAPNDGALDQAEVLSISEVITVPAGEFEQVHKILETTELEPDAREHKLYAPEFGLVLIEEDLDESGRPLNSIPLESISVIPLPPALVPGLIGAAVLIAWTAWAQRRRRHI
jgi:hypothetical protein